MSCSGGIECLTSKDKRIVNIIEPGPTKRKLEAVVQRRQHKSGPERELRIGPGPQCEPLGPGPKRELLIAAPTLCLFVLILSPAKNGEI